MNVDAQAQALLDLVEADRACQIERIVADAKGRAAALRAQARADSRQRMRQAFAEQRALQREQVAAAQARLATKRRLHEQQRTAATLRLAWDRFPGELLCLWRDATTRRCWVSKVLESARPLMQGGAWHIAHAIDWPVAEQLAAVQALQCDADAAPAFEPDARISAGLKIVAAGNVIDGTLDGLLADRSELESRLLHLLESSS